MSLEDHMVQPQNACLIRNLNLDMHIAAPVRFTTREGELLLYTHIIIYSVLTRKHRGRGERRKKSNGKNVLYALYYLRLLGTAMERKHQ